MAKIHSFVDFQKDGSEVSWPVVKIHFKKWS